MRKALIYWVLPLVAVFCMQTMAFADDVDSSGIPRDRWIHVDGEFVRQLQQRDSILIGDQLEYGFRLEGVEDGTVIGFPKLQESVFELIEDWTEKVVDHRSQGEDLPLLLDIEASIKVAAFEEGAYSLPPIVIGRVSPDGKVDTLFFTCNISAGFSDTAAGIFNKRSRYYICANISRFYFFSPLTITVVNHYNSIRVLSGDINNLFDFSNRKRRTKLISS